MLFNAASFVGTFIVKSGFGFAFWWIAARQFSPASVGLASGSTWREDIFVVGDYLREKPHEERVGELVFANVHRPLEAWSRFFEDAGLLVESLQEIPRDQMRRWSRLPMFLFLRAVKS